LALRGREHCKFHLTSAQRQKRIETQRTVAQAPPVELPPLEDLNSIHLALAVVMNEMLSGRIADKSGGQLLYGLQLARTNLLRATEQPAEEFAAVQSVLTHVMADLLQGRITGREAGRLLFGVQMAMSNIRDGADLSVGEEEEAADCRPLLR
jgi:hypothetical protein